MVLFDSCTCLCHTRGSVIPWSPPPVTDPVESLAACARCAVLHAGVWTVVSRGNPMPQADGEE